MYWLYILLKRNAQVKWQRSVLETKRDLYEVRICLSAPFRGEFKEEVKVDHVVPRGPLLLALVAPNFLLQAPNFHPRGVDCPDSCWPILYLLLRSWPMRMRSLLV